MNTETIIILISVIIYGIVFFIQKAQISKQNEIFNKYEKIFSIINIDEIEKYIELQKKSMALSINNREAELTNNEKFLKENLDQVESILDGSKTNLENSSKISEEIKDILSNSQNFITKMGELNIAEFSELHSLIKNSIEKENPLLWKEIEPEMNAVIKKYDVQKREAISLISKAKK
jgi:hypothetical protein